MEKEFKHLVRIVNTDLKGSVPVGHALMKIQGVSFNFSNAICSGISIDKSKKVGDLSEKEIELIDDCIKNPKKYNIPEWMYNRRGDVVSGEDRHVVSSDLKIEKEFDIKRLKKIKSYKGLRHAVGLPVRGPRTRSNFRKKKGTVKKKLLRRKDVKDGGSKET